MRLVPTQHLGSAPAPRGVERRHFSATVNDAATMLQKRRSIKRLRTVVIVK
jgi:hypothetical protein